MLRGQKEGPKQALQAVARLIEQRVGGPGALARFLHEVAAAWPARTRAEPPLWRLLATPRRFGAEQLRRLPPRDLVRLHSLPDMIAAHAARGASLPGAPDIQRIWAELGLAGACLDALEIVPDGSRAGAARRLLQGAGSGLSNRALDRLLGIDVDAVAAIARHRIDNDPELEGKWCWQDSGSDVTQTRYEDLVTLTRSLEPGTHIVDLGSGFGRLGFILGLLRPSVRFTGLEIVRERVIESNRATNALGLDSTVMHRHTDLDVEPVPAADAYFLFFSFPERTASDVLEQLREIARSRPISIFVHGMWPGTELDEVPWLRAVPIEAPFCRFVSAEHH